MAIADKAGLVTVEKVNSETLPEAAKIISDTLTQAAVILNGTLNGIEGERILAMQGLKDDVTGPILSESKAWRDLLQAGFEGNIGGMPFSICAKSHK